MTTKRQHQVARLILKDLADIFQKEFSGGLHESFVTITDVEVSPDLAIASIYLSVLKATDKQSIVDQISMQKSHLRGALGRRIGKKIRIVPELRFFLDDSEDKAMKIETLIDSLEIPPEDPPTESE